MSPDWYQTHQLCNTSDDFCATLNCYRYGEEDRVQWNQFDYVNNVTGQMENFMPNTDFDFGELWRIIQNEGYARNTSHGEIEERIRTMEEDIVNLRQENERLTNSQLQEYLSNLASDGYLPSENLDLVLQSGNDLNCSSVFVF